jgi:predicted RNA-binding protein Jag
MRLNMIAYRKRQREKLNRLAELLAEKEKTK